MTLFKRMLITTDGSEDAKKAAIRGLELAKIIDSEVTSLSVVDLGYATRGPRTAQMLDYLKDDAEAAVDQVRREGDRMGINVKTIMMSGSPANEIIEASKDFDLIVMGSLGRTGLSHMLMGSVAEKVVRLASCPVLVIKS